MNLRVSYNKSFSEKPDQELWSDFKAGDRDAFTYIYYQNVKSLIDYALKITSDKDLIEECIQEMYLDLWVKRSRLNDVQVIKNYLFTSLRRRIFKALKSQELLVRGNKIPNEVHFELPIDLHMISREDDLRKRKSLYDTLKKLSPEQREIIYLRFFSNFSFDEIATILGTNKKSIYNSLSKSMIKFRKAFNNFSFSLFL